jgi:hypothetical protein
LIKKRTKKNQGSNKRMGAQSQKLQRKNSPRQGGAQTAFFVYASSTYRYSILLLRPD